jgi:hypothetical protein
MNSYRAKVQLLPSFWIAGFESACHINRHGTRVDPCRATQHDRELESDYGRARDLGFRVMRESVRWHAADRGSKLDFSTVRRMLEAGRRQQVQIWWTLCHYGWPDDLALLSAQFVARFARYCRGVARTVAEMDEAIHWYTPINEISFLAWAAGEKGYFYPFLQGKSDEIKRQLVRSTIAAIEAVREVDPRARFVLADPLIHVVAPRDRPDLAQAAASQRATQFEAWDMLEGRRCPELGGGPQYLDLIGANFYHANEWEYPDQRLRWEDAPRDSRWVPLHRLLAELHVRYRRTLVISETSHFGAGRSSWLREVTEEAVAARAEGVPLEGLCVYPVIDRPDWDNPAHWHNSGLWDLRQCANGRLERIPCTDYIAALQDAQRQIQRSAEYACSAPRIGPALADSAPLL